MGSSSNEGPPSPSSVLPPLSGAGLDDLLRELLARVDGVVQDQRRLRLLLDAVVGIAADLSLDSVLARIVQVASELADARYAALGVLGGGSEQPLRAFIHHGISEQQGEQIGDLPSGHGLLGLIIDRPEPLRLHDIAEHAASYGFPEHHPEMRSFLGVPVRIGDRVFGNLYLTEKAGDGDFTEQDEAVVVALAAAAGVVIENALLYEEGARREQWLEATAEIAGSLVGGVSRVDALQTVADRARQIASADLATVVVRAEGDHLEVEVISGAATPEPGVDAPLSVHSTLAGTVIATGETVVVENVLTDDRVARHVLPDHWPPTLGPMVLVPLRTPDGIEGVLTLAWTRDRVTAFRGLDVQMPERFAAQAALALQVDRGREDREKLAVFEDRDRIGRDLHDLVIQRLFAIGLGLENTARVAEQPEVADRVAAAVDDIDETIKDIRRSIFALSVAADSADVRAMVGDLVERAAKVLGFAPTLRFEGPVNSAVSSRTAPHLAAVLGEALTNVARHADATRAWVHLAAGRQVVLTVGDDGRGIAPDVTQSGLRNIRERAEDLEGTCSIESAPGDGTVVTWTVPAG
ncbi:GAF domain-containing sensor histidine kinase [Nocardioides panacis]|uniref:GAF domain-containing sensor histidine kinase n=1 Tax=Nocardioides panacis TaxID=2849501 RepID=A0A975SZL4_9ACTN|nr:GAF domain-containing sensor histidine kinase [Nocardioides panacis]QWZ08867.1 GAF domain-containing sensor histidine kinase [Nocardioides panacis]